LAPPSLDAAPLVVGAALILILMMAITCRTAAAQDAGASPDAQTEAPPPIAASAETQRAPWASPGVPAATAPAIRLDPAAPPAPRQPALLDRWWFWAGVGAVVAAAGLSIYLLTRTPDPPGCPTGQGYVCPR
jgi:hypothetical protein